VMHHRVAFLRVAVFAGVFRAVRAGRSRNRRAPTVAERSIPSWRSLLDRVFALSPLSDAPTDRAPSPFLSSPLFPRERLAGLHRCEG
jgi:hypothetical protein